MSSRAQKNLKRGIFEQLFSPKPVETIKGAATKEATVPTSHNLGMGAAQRAGAAARGRKSRLDSAIEEATK